MPTGAVPLLTSLAILGSGLIAGVFFAFSAFVMTALARLTKPEGIRAMQSINVVVINPVFLGAFLGTALVAAALSVIACLQWSRPGSASLIAAGLLYLLGCFGVTSIFNVPLNDRLAGATPDSSASAAIWDNYLQTWVRWNHLRTACSFGAAVAYMRALTAS